MGRPKGTEKKALTVRLPELLIARISAALGTGTMTDWVETACREKLDGPVGQPEMIMKPRSLGLTAAVEAARQTEAPVGRSISKLLETAASGSRLPEEPTEEQPAKRDWQKFLLELDEMEPEEAKVAQSEAFYGLKVPRDLLSRPNRPKLLRWLQVNT
jgi:hypothetical protein